VEGPHCGSPEHAEPTWNEVIEVHHPFPGSDVFAIAVLDSDRSSDGGRRRPDDYMGLAPLNIREIPRRTFHCGSATMRMRRSRQPFSNGAIASAPRTPSTHAGPTGRPEGPAGRAAHTDQAGQSWRDSEARPQKGLSEARGRDECQFSRNTYSSNFTVYSHCSRTLSSPHWGDGHQHRHVDLQPRAQAPKKLSGMRKLTGRVIGGRRADEQRTLT
jgi:hypothetical protein